MAPSAVSEMTAGDLKESRDAIIQESKVHVHGTEGLTPLQAISHGPIAIAGIPTFPTFREHRRHILIHTAAVFRDFARKGFTEGMSGHISVRDPEFSHFIWMNPLGRHFGLMAAGDLICLDLNSGAVVGGNRARPANAAGFLIHSEIHKARPDAHAVCHAHTIAGRAWSAFARPLDMMNQDICNFHNALAVYSSYGGIVFAADEGKNIAKALGKTSKGAILMNHGLLTVGSTVDEAGFMFGLLDRGCQIQLQVEAACSGNPSLKKHVITDAEAAYNFKMASDPDSLYAEMQPDLDYVFEMDGLEAMKTVARGFNNAGVFFPLRKSTRCNWMPCHKAENARANPSIPGTSTVDLCQYRHYSPTTHGFRGSLFITAPDTVELRDMADQAHEPLIGNGSEEFPDPGREDIQDLSLPEDSLVRPGLFVWLLTFSAGISGLLFGYDTGVISATLVSVGSSLSNRPLSTLDKSLITACTSLFALLVSPASGLLADRFGRKKVILLADILFILGAIIQAITISVWGMIFGRSIVGLAVGAASFVVPLYIAELAPAKFRGRLVTLNVLFITLGQVVAYLIGWGFAESGGANGWRWMVGLGAVPAGVQCLVMMLMPESPRWLVKVGRSDEANVILQKVFGAGGGALNLVHVVLKGIEHEVREEEEARRGRLRGKALRKETSCMPSLNDSWSELFMVPGNRRALTIACLLQGLQQLCGFNSLMYFSATLFSLIGFSTPTLTSLSVAITNFIFTILSLLLIDFLGRRRILLLSIPIMSFALLGCALAFHSIILPSDTNAPNPAASLEGVDKVPWSERASPLMVLASIVLYVAAYATGLGNVPWQQSELFPLNIRSLGSGLSTATNWGSNFLVGATFLPMLDLLTPSWTFVIYAVVCLVGWCLIWLSYPETKGLSLEETGELLRDGWGVERSLRRRGEQGRVTRTLS